MADFLTAYKYTMQNEGQYVNDPLDKGGETYRGISRRYWPTWAGWAMIDNFKKSTAFPANLAVSTALYALVIDFYREKFWNINRLTEIQNQSIATELFDTGVNMSTGIAATFLQRALNVLNRNQKDYPDMKVDGVIGKETILRTNNFKNQKLLYDILNTYQGNRYISNAEADPTQERFMYGWATRVYEPLK